MHKKIQVYIFFLSLSFSSVLSYLASSSSFCCLFNLDPIKSVIFTLFSFDMKQKMMMINSRPIRCLFLSTANPLIINEIVDETKENILFFLLLLISCDKEKKKKDELNYFFVTIKKKKNYYYYERIFYFLFFYADDALESFIKLRPFLFTHTTVCLSRNLRRELNILSCLIYILSSSDNGRNKDYLRNNKFIEMKFNR